MLTGVKSFFSVLLSVLMFLYAGLGRSGFDRASLKPMEGVTVETVTIPSEGRELSALLISPEEKPENATGVLWIHGGGYLTGMKEMAFMGRAYDLVKNCGAVVLAPDYTLSVFAPYPAAQRDCYHALLWLRDNAASIGVNGSQLAVGGESAGGGLCASVCMMARDTGEVNVAFQTPLYPMLDNRDTPSSEHNFSPVWNTPVNHLAWRLYLRGIPEGELTPYAVPALQTDYAGLPPAYTFVGDGEPFYCETLQFIENLQNAGVEAKADVYHYNVHAVDMLEPLNEVGQTAAKNFYAWFAYAQQTFFAAQPDGT